MTNEHTLHGMIRVAVYHVYSYRLKVKGLQRDHHFNLQCASMLENLKRSDHFKCITLGVKQMMMIHSHMCIIQATKF